jgi:serine/threonine protein kinase
MVALSARIWEYRGPHQALRDLTRADEIAELIRNVVREGQGRVSQLRGNMLVSQFENPFNALSAAKSLQVRLLTVQQEPPAHQIVAAIVVYGGAEAAPPHAEAIPMDRILVEACSAQILVTERIYEAAKTIPGFQFNAKPAREAGEAGCSEALYELLWTDDSTYSHVRKAGEPGVLNVPGSKRYQIQSELGRGGMGVVYKAVDQVIGRTVALKTIPIRHHFGGRDEMVERLKLEAKAAGSLDHPNIITIYDVGQEEGFVYLSMQLVEGKTLSAVLDEGELPPLLTLLSYADQICAAVGFAHQHGVIHRDLKPANFMLTGEGTIKVLDFGIAKLSDATVTQVTKTGVLIGTPTYMAPEQASGRKLDQRSDIFVLGTVFYELFAREKPFKGDIATVLYQVISEDPTPPSVINPALPNGIDAIIRKALAKDPKDRYQTCEEMREAFREQATLLKRPAQIEASLPVEPKIVQLRQPPRRRNRTAEIPGRSNRSIWIGVAAVVVAASLLAAWSIRVKARTGSFPTALQRLGSAMRVLKSGAHLRSLSTSAPAAAPTMGNGETSNSGAASDNEKNVAGSSSAREVLQPASVGSAGASSDSGSTHPPAAENSADSSPTIVQPSSAAASTSASDNVKSQSEGDSSANTPTAGSSLAVPDHNEKSQQAASSPLPTDGTGKRTPVKSGENEARVEGFSRSDIPDLLRKADAAAGAGDYALAKYEYGIVLRLDPQNSRARSGLARVLAAKEER